MRYLLHHLLVESTNSRDGHEAFVDGGKRLSFADASRFAGGLAASMREAGIKRGDRVAIQMTPGVNLALAITAISMADAAFVPVHHSLFADQVAHIMQDCDAAALITEAKRLDKLRATLAECPALRFVIATNANEATFESQPVLDFEQCLLGTPADAGNQTIGKDLGAILYTSGSTGRPKGVMLSHANLIAGAEIVAQYLSLTRDDRLLAALPLSFDAGLNQLTTAMLVGGTAVMIDFRFGRDITRRLVDEEITGLAGVPTLWSLLAQPSSGLATQPLPHLRYITNTGGAMPQNVLGTLRATLPETKVFLMYGLTEAFRSTYLPPDEIDNRPTSMGKAIPNTEIMVVNEAGDHCGPGETGELVHHGPTVSLGYWNQPELTRKVLRPHPLKQPGRTEHDTVCYSGDLVTRDEDGFLYFVGRRDNQIKSAGFRISPDEVEEVLHSVAPLRQAAVVGVPDELLGQHLVAFAIAQEKAGKLDPQEILAACAAKLPRHMVPKQVNLVGTLPMTANGKVDYTSLRKSLQDGNRVVQHAD